MNGGRRERERERRKGEGGKREKERKVERKKIFGGRPGHQRF